MPDSFLYRRQFVLGPETAHEFPQWASVPIGKDLVVRAHPDLPLQQVTQNGVRATLLGYLIDPTAPSHKDHQILVNLLSACRSAADAPAIASHLGGRWVMLVDDDSNSLLFHDPCGLREVFFSNDKLDQFWCASQPERIAEINDLQPSDEARTFMATDYFAKGHEPWWPGDKTAYDEITHLLPNHVLDLRTRKTQRFWPTEHAGSLDFETAAQAASELLRKILEAAGRRFRLALPLTAGMDSRMILAAAKPLDGIWHYTALRDGLTRASADIVVPGQLLARLGKQHHVLECEQVMSDQFADVYSQNVSPAHDSAGAIAEGVLKHFPQGHVSLSGHCSEIARDTYDVTHKPPPTAKDLAGLVRMNDNPYAIEQFDNWLEATRPVCDALGYRAWDLFFWEQEYGVWAANGQSQWDLIHERMTPFNHRGLLNILLQVDPQFRRPPDYSLFRRIVEILNAELLSEPFNSVRVRLAPRIRARAKASLQRLLNRVGSASPPDEVPK